MIDGDSLASARGLHGRGRFLYIAIFIGVWFSSKRQQSEDIMSKGYDGTRIDERTAFVAVAEHKTFTAAAKALGHSKGAISKRVCGYEKRLGLALFTRTTRRVELTNAGRALQKKIAPFIHLIEQREQEIVAQFRRV